MQSLDTAYANLARQTRAQRDADFRARRAQVNRMYGLGCNATPEQIHVAVNHTA